MDSNFSQCITPESWEKYFTFNFRETPSPDSLRVWSDGPFGLATLAKPVQMSTSGCHSWPAPRSGFAGKVQAKMASWKSQTFPEEWSGPAISDIWTAGVSRPGALPIEVGLSLHWGWEYLVAPSHTFLGHFCSLQCQSGPSIAVKLCKLNLPSLTSGHWFPWRLWTNRFN